MRFFVAMAAAVAPVAFAPAGDAPDTVTPFTTLDEGRFLLSVGGTPAGSETFSIRRSGSGADARIIAQAQIELDGDDGVMLMAPAMEAEGDPMDISAYQIKVSGARQEEIFVTHGNQRFITKVRSEAGEQEREFRAAPGTLLLDEWVAHQFYFLAVRMEGREEATFPVIRPQEGRQYQLSVRDRGRETLSLAGTAVEGRRLSLQGGGDSHEVWVDDENRVLRVESPEAGYLAVRQEPPGG